jgi:hypothetical protein
MKSWSLADFGQVVYYICALKDQTFLVLRRNQGKPICDGHFLQKCLDWMPIVYMGKVGREWGNKCKKSEKFEFQTWNS